MTFKLTRKDFISGFLAPIQNLGSQFQMTLASDKITTTIVNSTSTVYANLEFKLEEQTTEVLPSVLNIPNAEKLMKVLNSMQDDSIVFDFDPRSNKIKCASESGGRFSMVLLDPSLMSGKKFDFSRLYQKKYETEFVISSAKFKEMIKAAQMMDAEKMYVTAKNGMVIAEFTDKAKKNVDEYEMIIASEYTGNSITNLCFDIQTLKQISTSLRVDLNVKISSLGIIMYEHITENISIKLATTVLKQ